jgi:hypothetical protein
MNESHLSNLIISCRQDFGYTCHLKFLKGFDNGVKHSGLLGFGLSQLSGILKKHGKKTAFQKLDLFLSSGDG